MSQSHSIEATDHLAQTIGDATRPLVRAINDLRDAKDAMNSNSDLMKRIEAAGSVIIATERLSEVAKEVAREARDTLRDVLVEVGCYGHSNDALTIALADAPRVVNVIDRKSLALARPDLFVTKEPEPDKKAIGDELRRGKTIPGAELTNGGPPVLRLATRKASK